MASAYFRCFLISRQIGVKNMTEEIKTYLKNCSYGDIFVLYQLSKNTHPTFFHEMLKQLEAEEMQMLQDEKRINLINLENETV